MRSSILLTSLFLGLGFGHPGHDLTDEILERRSFKNSVRSASLSHCADTLKKRGVDSRNLERRAAFLDAARLDRGVVKKRDTDTALGTSHNETDLGYSLDTSISDIFSGNASCVLTPEVTQGPYYVGGESIRRDITDSEKGVSIYLDYQVIDVDTCEPVPNVYLEIWHCNSTGVYSGVVASGNGNSNDEDNINKTFLRGIQQTDSDGVAQFESTFPGHYTGRATHIHVLVHTNATEFANHTLGNEIYASHVGQSFFDQDLITDVEKLTPYSTNTQDLTTNADDSILAEEADEAGVDPLMSYTLLGNSVGDGILAWLAFGINTTYSGEVTPAAFLYQDGGVENADSGMGGGPGGGGPDGGSPPDGGPGGPPGSNSTSTPGGSSGTSSSTSSIAQSSPTDSGANKYTFGAVFVSLVGFLLPLLWML